jgi:acyl carrier protein
MCIEKEIRLILSDISLPISIENISSSESFSNYGVNSLLFIKIIVAIEDYYAIEFPDEKLTIEYAGTINQLCKIVISCINK